MDSRVLSLTSIGAQARQGGKFFVDSLGLLEYSKLLTLRPATGITDRSNGRKRGTRGSSGQKAVLNAGEKCPRWNYAAFRAWLSVLRSSIGGAV